jgi:hypothetical protein
MIKTRPEVEKFVFHDITPFPVLDIICLHESLNFSTCIYFSFLTCLFIVILYIVLEHCTMSFPHAHIHGTLMGTHHHYTVVRQISTLSYGFRETQRYQCRETHSQTLGWHLQRRYSTAHLPVQMPTTAYPKMSTL